MKILKMMLCILEKTVHFSVWIYSVLFSMYCFSGSSYNYFKNYKDEYNDFSEGISYLSGRRDKADIEWESINSLIVTFYPWIIIYLTVAVICQNVYFSKKILQLWQICFISFYILFYYGFFTLIIILIQPLIFLTLISPQSKTTHIWLVSCTTIVGLLILKAMGVEYIWDLLKLGECETNILIVTLFWLNLKCTSFNLEKQPSSSHALDLLSYCLYPPTFFSGPFILYEDFKEIYKQDFIAPLQSRFKKFIVNIIKTLFWFCFVNICLHFVYVNASSFHPKFIYNLDSWSLYGFGYTMGQYFHLKYIVIYGLSTSIASFENINVPHLPRCIGRIHLYSDMWKYFDPGLYKYLLRHIYIPLTRVGSYKPISSLVCFSYVYIWHGLEKNILIWTALNYIGIIFENMLGLPHKQGLKESYWKTRVNCMIAAPLLAVSAISNFYFFGGTEVGYSFVNRIYSDTLDRTLFLLFVLYCCCQVSTELHSVNSTKFI
ncbi:unnamed protein product [Phaedon cochleariae]|uniref:Protein-cysteine N-palmitoyltransferase Rasp n=1 Tax=Phaedon cochleariae TaxID=80249 RepID=A0A9P0DQG4_PHACE|nr:unnamed protein product [Phaedon cochleariae]